ncbi:hypothetical protein J6590_005097 [Homalodisca vitripennis]|nr:hypothetical protein J6590_005097 [Homalodisca vitripennis]
MPIESVTSNAVHAGKVDPGLSPISWCLQTTPRPVTVGRGRHDATYAPIPGVRSVWTAPDFRSHTKRKMKWS